MNESVSSVFYGNQEMRTTVIDNQMWWAVIDVCNIIEIKNSRKIYQRLDEDEKDVVTLTDSVGRKQEIQMVNEFGLYHILLTARTEKAKPFRRWVTHDVLPRIRKYGFYKLTIAEQKTNALNSIKDILGVTALDKKYYKMTLSDLKREDKFLKNEKSAKEEYEKVKEKYPYTEGDIRAAVNYYKWFDTIMIMFDIKKKKEYCYVLANGDCLFTEKFQEKARRYVSDPSYEWED